MIKEFIDLCRELFPSIQPYTAESAKKALSQFKKDGRLLNFITGNLNRIVPCQGDIFSEIPFYYMDADGSYKKVNYKAQLLTNTCDAERNENLHFAAILPLNNFNQQSQSDIKGNRHFQFFYIPDSRTENFVIDFGLITTISREAFIKAFTQNKINKIVSLSDIGFYMFICKLTVFFLRPEDIDVNESRDEHKITAQ
jgi:hypothetical protein